MFTFFFCVVAFSQQERNFSCQNSTHRRSPRHRQCTSFVMFRRQKHDMIFAPTHIYVFIWTPLSTNKNDNFFFFSITPYDGASGDTRLKVVLERNVKWWACGLFDPFLDSSAKTPVG